jgi:Domain of unknown function (DUF4352)/zinc-ribbon domain
MPFCSKCGKEAPPNSTFCMHCGSPLTAPVPRPTLSAPTRVSHIKRNMAVIGIIILMVVVLAAGMSSRLSPTTTSSEVQEGGTVTIGQAIIVKFGENEVPVRFIFNSASFNTTIGRIPADSGYKFLIVEVSVKNVGDREVVTYVMGDKWEVTVDKGYVYEEYATILLLWHNAMFTLRPEEEGAGYIVFEILNDTTPVEVNYYKPVAQSGFVWSYGSPSIILNLRGYAFETTTLAAQEHLTTFNITLPFQRMR